MTAGADGSREKRPESEKERITRKTSANLSLLAECPFRSFTNDSASYCINPAANNTPNNWHNFGKIDYALLSGFC